MKATDPVRRIEFRYLDGDPSTPLLMTASLLGAKAQRMSFFLTTSQVRARTKTVTRRAVGRWTTLKPGDKLVAIEKGQGLKAGEGHNVLALLDVISVQVEQLDAITADDCAREGFPGATPAEFVAFFLGSPTREKADAMATRGRIRGDAALGIAARGPFDIDIRDARHLLKDGAA